MVYLSEDDRFGHHGLDEALVQRARRQGLAGATVWRGVEGFGPAGQVRTARFPDAVIGLPLAVELIDTPERIAAFLPTITQLAGGSLMTKEDLEEVHLEVPDGSGPGGTRPTGDPPA